MLFELVFDYGEYDEHAPMPKDDEQRDQSGEMNNPWPCRLDPFSSYRAGFEICTYRLCRRVLTFHHIPDLQMGEKDYDGLVRSTEFIYSQEQEPTSARNPVYAFLRAVTQSGYKRQNGSYLMRSLPPLEFEYSQPTVHDAVEEVDAVTLENLPIGLDGAAYQWTDLCTARASRAS